MRSVLLLLLAMIALPAVGLDICDMPESTDSRGLLYQGSTACDADSYVDAAVFVVDSTDEYLSISSPFTDPAFPPGVAYWLDTDNTVANGEVFYVSTNGTGLFTISPNGQVTAEGPTNGAGVTFETANGEGLGAFSTGWYLGGAGGADLHGVGNTVKVAASNELCWPSSGWSGDCVIGFERFADGVVRVTEGGGVPGDLVAWEILAGDGFTAGSTVVSPRPGSFSGEAFGEIRSILDSDGLDLQSGGVINWAASTDLIDSPTYDVGLERDSAGVLEVTDGSTGTGDLVVAEANVTNIRAPGGDLTMYRGASGTPSIRMGSARTSFGAEIALSNGNPSAPDTILRRDSEGDIHLRPDGTIYDGNVDFLSHGFYNGTQYTRAGIRHATTTLTDVTGSDVTATDLVPAGAVAQGVATTIITALGQTNSTTGYTVGDGSDPDRYGVASGFAAGTDTDNSDATADPTGWTGSTFSIVLTATGGDFDGTGDIVVDVVYIAVEAD